VKCPVTVFWMVCSFTLPKMVVTIVFSSNLFFTEMRNMQSAVREHTRRVFQETEELRNQLVEKESNIQRRSRELNELVAQTDMERRKLEEERKKVRVNPIPIGATVFLYTSSLSLSHFRKFLNCIHNPTNNDSFFIDTYLLYLFPCRMLTKMIPSTWLELSNRELTNGRYSFLRNIRYAHTSFFFVATIEFFF
jgi:hypothetical protein